MPLIKDEDRKLLDPKLQVAVTAILEHRPFTESLDKYVSYAIYAIIKKIYDFNDIDEMIRAIGILEETKLALYMLEVLPMEQKIIARRWFDGDASR